MELSDLIHLNYKRVKDSTLFEGHVHYGERRQDFTDLPFTEMLVLTSSFMAAHPASRLIIQREEAPHPMALPPGLEQLLRDDPHAAAAELTLPPQRIMVRDPDASYPVLEVGLRYGYDTLADAFGDNLYLTLRGTLVENPLTGRWASMTALAVDLSNAGPGEFNARYQEQWFEISTAGLLATKRDRYYLPRAWNPEGGWIAHDELQRLYDEYVKEKSQ